MKTFRSHGAILHADFSKRRRILKIACLIHSLDGGGAERVLAGLANRLALRGHKVVLVTLDDGRVSRHPVDDAVRRVPLNVLSTPQRRVSPIRRLLEVRRFFRQHPFDVLLTFCDTNNLLGLAATVGIQLPVVAAERNDPRAQYLGTAKEWARRRLYHRASRVICLSDDVAQHLQATTGCRAVAIASAIEPPPTNSQKLSSESVETPAETGVAQKANADRNPHLGRPSESSLMKVVAVGRLEPQKGFDRLLRVLARIDRELPDWTLQILGEGSCRGELEQLADRLGLTGRVTMPGWVSPVWDVLVESDLFVLCSRYEGFPSALLEAMSAGVASLVVDASGGVRDIVRHDANAWLVENSEEAIAVGLRRLLHDHSLRGRLAERATEVVDRFGWEKMVDAYEEVLDQAAGSPRHLSE